MEPANFRAEAEAMQEQLVAWRRDLHRHPELGFQEVRTAGLVADHLTRLGYEIQTGIAHTGVVGLMEGGAGPGPIVMLRFDMDALPIQEANQVEYASQVPGVMHACGHDGHVSIGMGVAALLARHRDGWPGAVKLVFQPAEEGLNGAERMIREGVLENPRPDTVLALHLWNQRPLGEALVAPGPVMAAVERWELTVVGEGGHGAMPHQTVDPIVATAQIITALQSIVSRNVDPRQAAVISVGTIHGGETFNVIPETVTLTGTIRTFDGEVRERVLRRTREVIEGVAGAMGAHVELTIEGISPALVNDPTVTALVQEVAQELLGSEAVIIQGQTTGGEDAAFFLREVPGCYLFLGSANPERGLDHPHHSPRFDFDERVLPLGVALLTTATVRLLSTAEGPTGR